MANETSNWLVTDDKFVKTLVSGLFQNGLHAWWVIGYLFILFLSFVVFAFFASSIDAHNYAVDDTLRLARRPPIDQQRIISHARDLLADPALSIR